MVVVHGCVKYLGLVFSKNKKTPALSFLRCHEVYIAVNNNHAKIFKISFSKDMAQFFEANLFRLSRGFARNSYIIARDRTTGEASCTCQCKVTTPVELVTYAARALFLPFDVMLSVLAFMCCLASRPEQDCRLP